MRKLWYAGAVVASGIILFAASPAQADEQPTSPQLLPGNSIAPPFGDLLSGTGGYAFNSVRGAGSMAMSSSSDALNGANDAARQANGGLDRVRRPTNNLHVAVPLDGSRPLTQVQPGTNSPALLPRSAKGLPAADVIDPLQSDDGTGDSGDVFDNSLFSQLPLLGGLMPNGQQQQFSSSLDRPTVGETEGLPLLGGLLPVPGTPDVPSVSGLPGGGMTVLAPATASHDRARPAAAATATPAAPAATPSTAAPTSDAPVDPRLHEEPIDPSERTFSPDGRPVAGIDKQYN